MRSAPQPHRRSGHINRDRRDRELTALRLALLLASGLVNASVSTWEHLPFGDCYEAAAWLREQLGYLARDSATVRSCIAILDIERASPLWSDPRRTKQELLRLAARVRGLGHG